MSGSVLKDRKGIHQYLYQNGWPHKGVESKKLNLRKVDQDRFQAERSAHRLNLQFQI